MLLKTHLSAHALDVIVQTVSRETYDGNLTLEYRFDGKTRDGRNKHRFTLAVHDSRAFGARRSASGRHMPKASWQAHKYVIQAIFAADPAAHLHTALANYDGRDDFLAKFEATGSRNVGSQMRPARFRDLAV